MITLTFQMESELYQQLNVILAKDNLSFEEAIILFIQETVKQGKLPFEYTEADIEEARNNPIVTVV